MNLLTITCYTGGKDHVAMTDAMLTDLLASIGKTVAFDIDHHISILAQGTKVEKWPEIVDRYPAITFEEEVVNRGFAHGMNQALINGVKDYPDWDAVLCINNDILMPHKNWFCELMFAYTPNRIMCPTTNFTGANEQRATEPVDKPSFDHVTTAAVCWLMSKKIVEMITSHQKGKLFPDDLGGRAWGEDFYVASIARTKVAPRPFRIVPKAWIHHIGGQTSEKIPVPERHKASGEARRRAKKEGLR